MSALIYSFTHSANVFTFIKKQWFLKCQDGCFSAEVECVTLKESDYCVRSPFNMTACINALLNWTLLLPVFKQSSCLCSALSMVMSSTQWMRRGSRRFSAFLPPRAQLTARTQTLQVDRTNILENVSATCPKVKLRDFFIHFNSNNSKLHGFR